MFVSSNPCHRSWQEHREVRWPNDMASVLALRNTFLVQACTELSSLQHVFALSICCLHAWCPWEDWMSFDLRTCGRTVRSAWVACTGWWRPCRAIAVDWCAPCELSAGGATFNFSPVESHYRVSFEVGEFRRATCERASWMSNLRSFLRFAVSRFMALVRQRDCGSLTEGMVHDPMWRHALKSVMHRQSGPCLLCAGQWSKTGLFVARLAEDGICPRCKDAPENLMHRLWYCRANEQNRFQLNSLVPAAVSFLDSLPHALARTGIPLAGWDVLSLEEFKCFLNYLWCCVADDTMALAREYRAMPEAPPFCF